MCLEKGIYFIKYFICEGQVWIKLIKFSQHFVFLLLNKKISYKFTESLTFQTKSPKTSRTTCGGKCFLDLNPWSNYEDIMSTVVR